ncbi:phage holin family protein [Paracoccus lutimaris]|nr:phage holin family protein [Paracoccus lutimaris]
MQLALTDKLRRGGLMAGAGAVLLVGLGFLLAALWTWLATYLEWGPLWASLAIGAGFVSIGFVLMLMAAREKHPTPSTDELRAEIEERANLMVDAALDKASQKATRLMDAAGQRVQTLSDRVVYGADRYADRAEAQAQAAAQRIREASDSGLKVASETLEDVTARVKHSNTAAIAPLIGAFAIGLTLASRLRNRHRGDDDWDNSGNGA